MKINFTKTIARILLLAFLTMMILLFTGCASVKKLFSKKVVTVSEIVHNDIQKKETEKIETAEFIKTDAFSWSATPIDETKPSKVIINGTPVDLINAKLEYAANKKEENRTITQDKTTENTDKSKKEASKSLKEKNSSKEKKGISPTLLWILFLLILIAGVVLYLKKKIPFL